MKIILANGGGPGMDGVFLSGYGDGDYTPCPRSGPLPSLYVHIAFIIYVAWYILKHAPPRHFSSLSLNFDLMQI